MHPSLQGSRVLRFCTSVYDHLRVQFP
jgi:hypothetical protein